MRRAHPVLAGVVLSLTFVVCAQAQNTAPALPVVPDDTPWTVDDANPGSQPATIDDLLARDQKNIIEDHDIAPPGQDQPDYVQTPAADRMEEDRLTPRLPAEIHPAPERGPETAIRSLDSPPLIERRMEPTQVTPATHPPQAPRQGAAVPRTMPQTPSAPETIAPATAPRAPVAPAAVERANVTPAPATHQSRSVEAVRPPEALPQPATPAALPAAAPAQQTVATDGYDPHAPPPLAVPSSPVNEATVAVNGKLYLPLKRYFDSKAEATLASFDLADRTALAEYYDKTLGEALWVTKDGFNAAAQSLIAEIEKADDWGLASADYKIPGLARVGGGEFDYELLTDTEIKLSLVAMEYARHARGDRIDTPAEQLSSYIDRKPQLIERAKLVDALATASDKGAYLRSLHPKHAQFELLREKLLELRAAQKSGNEPEPIADGPKITPGKVHWQVALLRKRLNVAMAAAKPDGSPMEENYYDENLARAVIQYKEKNAIEPVNATVTSDLRKSLNKKARLDERTLLANMEQWRWMPDELGETYVWVNIPEFLVRVKKQNRIIHEERIVTGRYETQTPIFSNRMKTVVFQPSWNVPESIKVNELLPKLRAGGNPIAGQGLKLERNGREIDVWDVDWNRQDIREYHIYQPPGDADVLGIVKFLFPNKHSVYLHDTPSKRLFNEKVRTFSHGCMRVRNPVQLAEVIMAEDKGWDKAKIHDLITTGPEENDVALDRPMPVHVTYFTAWVDATGEVQTFADIYGHEQRIKLGLEGRWEEIVKNRDHLAPSDPGVVASREDWGDQDEDRPRLAKRQHQRYSFDDESRGAVPRGVQPPAPGYRQVYPKKKSGSPIADIFKNIFGNN